MDQTFTFRRIIFSKLHHIQVLTFDINSQNGSGSGTQLPLALKFAASTASASLLRNVAYPVRYLDLQIYPVRYLNSF